MELDKNTAFNTYGVICLPRSLSVHTGDRTRSHKTIAKKIDMQASDCSLTNSKSAKRRTKLAVLIITHLSSTTNVTCILDDPVPVLHTSSKFKVQSFIIALFGILVCK